MESLSGGGKFCLWLNRKKVYTASEISENLDIAALLGYFKGGSLIDWLLENGGEKYAKQLKKLSPDAPDICEKFEYIFGGKSAPYKELGAAPAVCSGSGIAVGCSYKSSFKGGSFSRTFAGSFSRTSAGSFNLSSFFAKFGSGSFFSSSGSFFSYSGSFYLNFLFGSGFYEWEWEWERFFSSFYKGSFVFGSGGLMKRLWLMRSSGSFNFGSYKFGKFGSGGSQNGQSFVAPPFSPEFLDEYDRIMLESLFGCPLNQFGYGIHNI